MARRSWTGLRRPTEVMAIRRLEKERRSEPSAEWWRSWNEMDGGEWARETADDDAKARNLLRVLMGHGDDDEAEKMRRLARALGIDLGGDK